MLRKTDMLLWHTPIRIRYIILIYIYKTDMLLWYTPTHILHIMLRETDMLCDTHLHAFYISCCGRWTCYCDTHLYSIYHVSKTGMLLCRSSATWYIVCVKVCVIITCHSWCMLLLHIIWRIYCYKQWMALSDRYTSWHK